MRSAVDQLDHHISVVQPQDIDCRVILPQRPEIMQRNMHQSRQYRLVDSAVRENSHRLVDVLFI